MIVYCGCVTQIDWKLLEWVLLGLRSLAGVLAFLLDIPHLAVFFASATFGMLTQASCLNYEVSVLTLWKLSFGLCSKSWILPLLTLWQIGLLKIIIKTPSLILFTSPLKCCMDNWIKTVCGCMASWFLAMRVLKKGRLAKLGIVL